MIKKTLSILIFLALIIPLNASAQIQTQEVVLTIFNGGIAPLHQPDNFAFDPVFINNITPFNIYKALEPDIYENQFVIEDADTSGLNFYVTLSLSNLIDQTSVVPFSNFSMVTLADDPSGVDPYTPSSPPANTVGVTAPLACPWAGDLINDCTSELNLYYFPETLQFFAFDPVLPVNSTDTDIYVSDEANYTVNEIIEFSDGEKALVLSTTAGSPDYITVARGVLETTPADHPAGSGIISHGDSSAQMVFLEGPEPSEGRIGSYSVGFGFKGIVEPDFEPGDYTGTITYTLYIY